VCVDEIADNGSIGFIHGSHRLGNLNLTDREGLRDYTDPPELPGCEGPHPYYLMPGDMLVWSALTVHGSRPNTSTRMRMLLMNGFARSSACDAWPHYLRDGEVVPMDAGEIPYE